eukprot:CAMPEP_0172385844 /NCGR_PEP_ID=MMETSP1061-20121228/3454_1 /TAXON_ID=37318 /ORGANISM="Pseudo-nitzschia pungens, Strain cf. pungens" /LENGTH=1877 /DNA_ID=CAMNT_0013115001 /DNA_START=415 /DNA_END=6048 /DNA_ORIENTATION=-
MSTTSLLFAALSVSMWVSTRNVAAANPEIDYTCNPANDYTDGNKCQTIQNGICDDPRHGGSGGDACFGQDCIDCNFLCRQFDADCYGCLNAKGCYYCPEDGTCENSNLYVSKNKVLSCTEPEDFLSSVLGDTPETCIPQDAVYKDPLWSGSKWMYDAINVIDVWETYGLTGKGITVRINDDGVYVSNKEFEGRFDDQENSCGQYLPNTMDQEEDGHGTSVAGIILGNANNDLCAVGIAHQAKFSSCNFFAENVPYSALAYKLDSFEISQNSVGLPACDTEGLTGFAPQSFEEGCPFQHSESRYDPCTRCVGEFVVDQALSTACESAIARHCKDFYKLDQEACSDFPEIVIGGDCNFERLPKEAIDAIQMGIRNGRDGKGIIFTYASGNSFAKGDNINFSGWSNSRYTITIGAVGKDGLHSDYSTPGAALLLTAPGGDGEDFGKLMTAGLGTDKCVDSGQGTSFACPVVTGVVALILEANSNLSWRDVQGIFAQTSQRVENDPLDTTDVVNAAGFWHSNWYGFGVVDAKAAVEAAMNWTLYSEELQAVGISEDESAVLSQDSEEAYLSTIVLDPEKDSYPTDFVVESTVVLLDLSHYNRGDLQIELESPSGTKSLLSPGKRPEDTQLEGDQRWKLMTVRNWGENPTGDWKVTIRDLLANENETPEANVFRQWTLIVYGRSASGQEGFGTGNGGDIQDEQESDVRTQSQYCLDPEAPVDGCAATADGNIACPIGSQFSSGSDTLTIDSNIVCPSDIVIGKSISAIEASQRGLCTCETGLYDENCDVIEADLDCDCFVCPTGSQSGVSYSCQKEIIGGCKSFDCDGTCNGPYNPPLKDATFPDISSIEESSPPLGQPVMSPFAQPVVQPVLQPFAQPLTTQPVGQPVLSPIGEGIPVKPPTAQKDQEQVDEDEELASEKNLSCENGIKLESNSMNSGIISTSTVLEVDESCVTGLETVAGWYEVEGNGTVYTLRACPLDPSNSVSISVFIGECSNMTCVENQSRQVADCDNGFTSSWVAELGQTYNVLVSGLPVGVEFASSTRRQLEPKGGPGFKLDFTEEEIPANNACVLSTSVSSENAVEGITVGGNSVSLHETCEETKKTGTWHTVSKGNSSDDGILVYEANTCSSKTNFYNAISVFRGDCESLDCVNIDVLPCDREQYGQRVYWTTHNEEEFHVFVHAADTVQAKKFDAGSYSMEISYHDRLPNDQCGTAIEVELGGEIIGSTEGAKPDMNSINESSCGIGRAGAWYRVVGTGGVFQASTCSSSTDHKTWIMIFSGLCGSLTCMDQVEADRSLCSDPEITAKAARKAATVNFKTQKDVIYYILVAGQETNGSVSGSFGLTLTEITPSPGNECNEALSLSLDNFSTPGTTLQATIDFSHGDVCGVPLDTPGVWYTIEGTGKGMEFSTCEDNNYNTAISIFKGSCNDLECITGTKARDPNCDNQGVTAAFPSEAKTTYYIYVHGTGSSDNMGNFTLTKNQFDVIESNEFCSQARSIKTDGSRIQGSTQDATHAAIQESSCGVEITNPGLWYTFNGTGQPFTISACDKDVEDFDVSVSVFAGDCDNLQCITGATFFDNYCSLSGSKQRQLQTSTYNSNFRFMTEIQKDYFLFVHGQEGVGDFDLFVIDENLENFGTTAPSATPIRYGTDLYRWTVVDYEIEIGTDYRSVTIVFRPRGTARVVGSRIMYTPPPEFVGEDLMTVNGCVGADCYRFDIVVSVMGDEKDMILAEGGDANIEQEGWNKLWLLLLLLVFIPCCTCVPFYIWYRKRKQENDVDGSESHESEDEFTDDDEEGGKLLPLKPKSLVVTDSVDSNSDEDWESDDDNDDSNKEKDESSHKDKSDDSSSDDSSSDDSSSDDDSESEESVDKEFEEFVDEYKR